MNHFIKIGRQFVNVSHIVAVHPANSAGNLRVETVQSSLILSGADAAALAGYLEKIAQELGPVGFRGLTADEIGMYCVTLNADEIFRFENSLRVASLHEAADLVRTYGIANAGDEYGPEDWGTAGE